MELYHGEKSENMTQTNNNDKNTITKEIYSETGSFLVLLQTKTRGFVLHRSMKSL